MKKISFLSLAAGVATLCGTGLAAAQDVYVSNNSDNTIAIIAPGGSTTTVGSSLLNGPTGMAFNSQGDLFIANNGGGDIVEYDPTTQVFSTYATGLANPRGLAFDSQGNLYVANQSQGTITEFAAGSSIGTTFASGLNTPNGIAIDSNGDLYVGLGANANSLAMITSGGTVTTFDTTGAGLNNPNGLVFGANGDLYVVNRNDPSVEQIALNQVGTTFISSNPALGLNSPKDLAFDANGDLYVTDNGNNTVTEYNAAGDLINTYSTDLDGPCYLAISPADLAVPEPSTYAMLFGGLGLLYYFNRRRLVPVKN